MLRPKVRVRTRARVRLKVKVRVRVKFRRRVRDGTFPRDRVISYLRVVVKRPGWANSTPS